MLRSWKNPFKKSKRRTPRVELEMPLRFRLSGESEWREGFAVNISSGGILFRADQALKINSPIQMNYILPGTIAGGPGMTVDCKGEILRAESPAPGGREQIFAAKILDYHPASQS